VLFDQESDQELDHERILEAVGAAPALELAVGALPLPEGDGMPQVLLFTDGGSSPNPGPGGWAFILRNAEDLEGAQEVEGAGAVPDTTNNRMELIAVIRGLLHLEHPCAVCLVSDSEYVTKGLSEWLEGWKARNWRNSKKKPVLNEDLWRILDRLARHHQVSAEWTRGHAGHPENERCDALVERMRADLIEERG
jgi:ribonuclease HI